MDFEKSEHHEHHGHKKHHHHGHHHEHQDEYFFDSFVAGCADFNSGFTQFLNEKASNGWEYEDCQYVTQGDQMVALCVFERD